MAAQRLADALLGLDPSNDNHWTGDGLPRLEAAKFLSGNPALTREQVTAAVPGLLRSNVAALAAVQGAATRSQGGSTTPAATEAPAAAQGPTQGAGDGDQGGGDGGDTADAEEKAGGDGDTDALAAAKAELAVALALQASANRRVHAAQEEVDRLLQEAERARPRAHVVNAMAVQQYLARQRANLQEQGEKRAALRGVNLLELLPQRAPIDSALARRTARGTARPTKV